MIFVGLLAAFGVSVGSFLLLISLTTPQSGIGVIILFFLTFFLALACLSAVVGMLLRQALHRENASDAQHISGGGHDFAGLRFVTNRFALGQNGSHFRRGLLLAAFATVLLGLETLNMLTLELSLLALAPFALIEAYAIRTSPSL